jgi:hypothetical protein
VERRKKAKLLEDAEADRALCSAAVATAPLQYVLPDALPTPENLAAAERKLARLDRKARGRERRLFHGMFG